MARLMVVDDERDIARAFASFFERHGGHAVTLAHDGATAIDAYRTTLPDVVLLDLRLPDMTGFEVLDRLKEFDPVVIMISGHGDVPLAVQALQNGAENFLTKPVELGHLAVAVERAVEKVRLRQLNRYLTDRRSSPIHISLGASGPMRELTAQIELLAASEKTTVLLLGESGSGKGRIAEMIHALSPRSAMPFIEVSCAALTATSLDAELFGHERSAGLEPRDTRAGLFEVANGGTLFLDEIGDLDPQLQPKLLRVLEGKSFRHLGGTSEVSVNVRLLAATNKDLVNEVTEGRFREDLYYRLSVMPVYLPPLRARSREDMVDLIGRLLDELRPQLPAAPSTISNEALDRLLRYAWPGNIRELRNVLERAMIMGRGAGQVEAAHLPGEVREASGAGVEHHIPRTLEEMERMHVERTLRAHDDNRTHTARELGISRATLIKKIKQYGLNARAR